MGIVNQYTGTTIMDMLSLSISGIKENLADKLKSSSAIAIWPATANGIEVLRQIWPTDIEKDSRIRLINSNPDSIQAKGVVMKNTVNKPGAILTENIDTVLVASRMKYVIESILQEIERDYPNVRSVIKLVDLLG